MPTTTTIDPNSPIDLTPGGTVNLNCIKARGVQLRKNYFGEAINYSDVLTTTLEVMYTSGKKVASGVFYEDLREWKAHMDNYAMQGVGEWRSGGISIYGLNFINCRIASLNFPTRPESRQNGVFGGTVTIVIEERVSGDLTNLAGKANYETLANQLSLYGHLIDDLTEDFSFTLDKGTQYGFTHTVNIRLTELVGAGNNLATSQAIANEILNPTATFLPNLGFAFNIGSYPVASANVSAYYSESVNLQTGDYSLTKTFRDYPDQVGEQTAYTYDLGHSVTQDQLGIVTVTESGKVKGKLSSPMGGLDTAWAEGGRFKNAKDGVTALISSSWARCNDLYSGGFLPNQSFGIAAPIGGGVDPDTNLGVGPLNLRPEPQNSTKNLDAISQECSYSVTYTDDPSQSWTLNRKVKRDSTLSCTQDISGNVIISENVEIISSGDRDSQLSNIMDTLSEDHGLDVSEGGVGVAQPTVTFGGISNWNLLLGSRARVEHYYQTMVRGVSGWNFPQKSAGGGVGWVFKLVSLSYNFKTGGKNGGYSVEFTSDPDIFEPAQNGVKRITLNTEDNFARKTKQEYPIPQWKVLIHDPNQSTLGVRNVSAALSLERVPGVNRLLTPSVPADAISYAAEEIRAKLLDVYIDYGLMPLVYPGQGLVLHFLTNCEYSFDSRGGASASGQLTYVQKL